jgi:hypothetical protein
VAPASQLMVVGEVQRQLCAEEDSVAAAAAAAAARLEELGSQVIWKQRQASHSPEDSYEMS